ncbi:hypothetical protein Bhyg_05766 [Pseudolycoriella hygida]|uniref:Uncharacterized protein n=1 Tax=Pseudolycoriella hygida TaxID=35572 RepID=A0A9Q0MZB6_9DIPT|nr:hypothetical protein Bhyg_05766 [Pseudolycoriella hygida]
MFSGTELIWWHHGKESEATTKVTKSNRFYIAKQAAFQNEKLGKLIRKTYLPDSSLSSTRYKTWNAPPKLISYQL